MVRISVGELRATFGDTRKAPRFIETVPRRGYRFIARMGGAGTVAVPGSAQSVLDDPEYSTVVGRVRERAVIGDWFRAVADGRRQIGFVSGDAGIGKTTLVDAVLRDLDRHAGTRLRVARGQCVEQYGGGEPFDYPQILAQDQLIVSFLSLIPWRVAARGPRRGRRALRVRFRVATSGSSECAADTPVLPAG